MSTNSSISVKTKTAIKSIYCHWDGDTDNNGRILVNFYNNQKAAENLVSFGGLSSLGETIFKSIFYCRDRQEDLQVNLISAFHQSQLSNVYHDGLEFHYYWDGSTWNCLNQNFSPENIYQFKDQTISD